MKNKLINAGIYLFIGGCTVYFAVLLVEELAK